MLVPDNAPEGFAKCQLVIEVPFADKFSTWAIGRPRKPKQQEASAFDIVLDKTLIVFQNGVMRELTVEEALQHRTYQDATGVVAWHSERSSR